MKPRVEVLIPRGVELKHPSAPVTVREWMEHRADWLEIRDLILLPTLEWIRRIARRPHEAIQLAIAEADFFTSMNDEDVRRRQGPG